MEQQRSFGTFYYHKNIKFFGKTETLSLSSTPNLFLQTRGYIFETKDRIKAGGDIAVYIKEGITFPSKRSGMRWNWSYLAWDNGSNGKFLSDRNHVLSPQTHQNTYKKILNRS